MIPLVLQYPRLISSRAATDADVDANADVEANTKITPQLSNQIELQIVTEQRKSRTAQHNRGQYVRSARRPREKQVSGPAAMRV